MTDRAKMMHRLEVEGVIPVGGFRAEMSHVLNMVGYGGRHVGIERHGKVVAYVISPEDMDVLRAARSQVSAEFREAAESAMKDHEKVIAGLANR